MEKNIAHQKLKMILLEKKDNTLKQDQNLHISRSIQKQNNKEYFSTMKAELMSIKRDFAKIARRDIILKLGITKNTKSGSIAKAKCQNKYYQSEFQNWGQRPSYKFDERSKFSQTENNNQFFLKSYEEMSKSIINNEQSISDEQYKKLRGDIKEVNSKCILADVFDMEQRLKEAILERDSARLECQNFIALIVNLNQKIKNLQNQLQQKQQTILNLSQQSKKLNNFIKSHRVQQQTLQSDTSKTSSFLNHPYSREWKNRTKSQNQLRKLFLENQKIFEHQQNNCKCQNYINFYSQLQNLKTNQSSLQKLLEQKIINFQFGDNQASLLNYCQFIRTAHLQWIQLQKLSKQVQNLSKIPYEIYQVKSLHSKISNEMDKVNFRKAKMVKDLATSLYI